MSRKPFLLVPLLILLLACSLSLPAATAPAISTPESVLPTVGSVQGEAGFTLVRLSPGGAGLLEQIQAEAPRAAALGQHMFVEFDASW